MKLLAIRKYQATLLYIVSVVLINTLFLYIPFVSVMGSTVTPADVTAGSIYIFRDFAQREIKHYVIVAMLIGSGISYFLANSTIAFASFAAFSTAELIDWGIFTLTQKPLSERLLISASISAPVDSFVFCHFVGTMTFLDFTLMTVAKGFGILLIWYLWKWRKKSELQYVEVDFESN